MNGFGRLSIGMGLAVLLVNTACQQSTCPTVQEGIVQIGSTKADLFGVPAEYRALHPRLEACFGHPVCFRSQPDGAAIGLQLAQGDIPYAIMTAAEFASVKDPSRLTLLATGINALGRTSHKAYLVVRADSHIKTISDCQGKRFAFGARNDLLTDYATRDALEKAGVPVQKLLTEILPPPVAYDGRLYLKNDVARTIVYDLTVNAGVIDEVVFNNMPKTGGNLIVGPSQDQFKIVGETALVPEVVVVAGPAADPAATDQFKAFLLDKVKDDKMICEQLGVTGFAPADRAAYDAIRNLLPAAQTATRESRQD